MNQLVIGLQWGDEGKGKAIDYLAGQFDGVVRYQGGHNAGHTIYHEGQKVVLHLLPSGVLTPGVVSVIAQGVVVDPLQLLREWDGLLERGIVPSELVVSGDAPLILPFHQALDVVREERSVEMIGTTRRGIGPAYEDYIARRGLLVRDLLDEDRFLKRLRPLAEDANRYLVLAGAQPVDVQTYLEAYLQAGRRLKPMVRETTAYLHELCDTGKNLLFEGAQGVLLDIWQGTYPFVTSSSPTVGGLFSGTGLSHKQLQRVVGVCKAYTTRVGEGPFPSELHDATGEQIRSWGGEYGATTGRPRRVGWLDLVALKHAVRVNGVDQLFLTKIDVLDQLDEIHAVVSYRGAGQSEDLNDFPRDPWELSKVKPVLRRFEGWKQALGSVRSWNDLPDQVRSYLAFIADYTGAEVGWLSVGPGRNETLRLSEGKE